MRELAPPPGEVHPWYAQRGDMGVIRDWVDRRGEFGDLPDLRMPVMPVIRFDDPDPDPSLGVPAFKTVRLTRRKAYSLAPWTHEPYHYEWYVGTDQYGRHVAGEIRVVRDDRHPASLLGR